jgi:hypothetical protein
MHAMRAIDLVSFALFPPALLAIRSLPGNEDTFSY